MFYFKAPRINCGVDINVTQHRNVYFVKNNRFILYQMFQGKRWDFKL
jgi:hypothetical protein